MGSPEPVVPVIFSSMLPASSPVSSDSPFAFDDGSTLGLWELVRADLKGMVIDVGRARSKYALEVAIKTLLYPRIRCVVLFRLSQWAWKRCVPLAYWLMGVELKIAGAEIHPGAQIGPGFCLVHSNGVVIGDRARIGAHFICFQGVTVGDSGKGDGQPLIGNWVTASAGAKILGGIEVGAGALVGANSVLLRSVPPGAVAVGAPARVTRLRPIAPDGKPLPAEQKSSAVEENFTARL